MAYTQSGKVKYEYITKDYNEKNEYEYNLTNEHLVNILKFLNGNIDDEFE